MTFKMYCKNTYQNSVFLSAVKKYLFLFGFITFTYGSIANAQDYGYITQDCNESGMACLPLQDCPQVNEIALKIQQLGDFQADKKIELLNLINGKLCGGRINKHLLVCCDKVEVPSSVSGNNYRGEEFLGSFNRLTFHPVGGDLYRKDSNTLVIRNFVYDGEGPDAFFVVGKRPMRRDKIVIRDRADATPIPYEDNTNPFSFSPYSRQDLAIRRYRYDDPDIPVLGRFDGQDIELTLPEGMEAENIRWISLYCRQFNMDFGHVKIGESNPWGRPRRT